MPEVSGLGKREWQSPGDDEGLFTLLVTEPSP